MVQTVTTILGDCRIKVFDFKPIHFDSIITDPPYSLGFMGKEWDKSCIAFQPNTWERIKRVMKPGGYLLAFGGTRTFHRLACAIEDAGFEIKDCLMWMYGSGFPKGKGCLKPAWEPIILACKSSKRVLPLGIEECKVGTEQLTYGYETPGAGRERSINLVDRGDGKTPDGRDLAKSLDRISRYASEDHVKIVNGRYPANVVHDGSEEVTEAFAAFGSSVSKAAPRGSVQRYDPASAETKRPKGGNGVRGHDDTGTAARFFYCAKASRKERGEGNTHPTVKPIALMKWLIKLVTPKGGKILDPFAGSGSTLLAARELGYTAVGIEENAEYFQIMQKRLGEEITHDSDD